MIPRVYLAASWDARAEIQAVAKVLSLQKISVVSHWHGELLDNVNDETTEYFASQAEFNKRDIEEADALIVFTDTPTTNGGFHWETGFAEGLGVPVFVIKDERRPPANLFFLSYPFANVPIAALANVAYEIAAWLHTWRKFNAETS